jgi:hypothetical protein
MLHYHFYNTNDELKTYLNINKDQIQCIVGQDHLPFGSSQKPGLSDYADGVDTLKWLNKL